ncbi:unnamed protein product [Dracunculus medinensis]|uniref:Uncharacterized protein n=1 Tax=Dracunculus medinensis TaxID=318479 RepID=A0A0N4UJI1_DRAME|nr:unnamed protein product [Dracunculus medinensis]
MWNRADFNLQLRILFVIFVGSQKEMSSTKQEDNNRKLLEELNRTRQLMMKNTGASGRQLALESNISRCDPRTVQLVNNLDSQTPITFIPTNSQHNNTILPVFPRFPPTTS